MDDIKNINILQQVDVTEIITSLALGIAEAQQKLDDNSLRQILKLTEQEVGGRSLLELGFVPAFYAFEYADISASINLKMSEKSTFDLGVSAKLDISNSSKFNKDDLDFLQEDKYSDSKKEFKSSRAFSVVVKNSEFITIEGQEYYLNQTEGVITRIENFKKELLTNSNISRVYSETDSKQSVENKSTVIGGVIVTESNGYITIALPYLCTNAYGILKIKTYNTDTIDLDGDPLTTTDSFKLGTDFSATFDTAKSKIGTGLIYGISDDNWYYFEGTTRKSLKLNIYFGWDKDIVDFAYIKPETTDEDFSESTMLNDNLKVKLSILALVLIKDPDAKIEIIGNTDSSGPDSYNYDLGTRRATNVKNYLKSLGVPVNQITVSTQGENVAKVVGDNKRNSTYRNVEMKIKSGCDYIYFEGGDFKITATPNKDSTNLNKFIFANSANSTQDCSINIIIKVNGDKGIETFAITSNTQTELQNNTVVKENFEIQIIDRIAYLLNSKLSIKYNVLSSKTEKIEMNSSKSSNSSESGDESSYLIDENINKSSILNKDISTIDSSKTFALSAAVDFRMTRQFEMSVEGNASISARLKSVPPPDEFKTHILNTFKNQ